MNGQNIFIFVFLKSIILITVVIKKFIFEKIVNQDLRQFLYKHKIHSQKQCVNLQFFPMITLLRSFTLQGIIFTIQLQIRK